MKTDWGLWTVRKEENEEYGEVFVVLRYYKMHDVGTGTTAAVEEYAGYKNEKTAQRKAAELNKEEITKERNLLCNLLFVVLRETANLSDLVDLTYKPNLEQVEATFENGAHKVANIACDSGTAAIVDIIRQIT